MTNSPSFKIGKLSIGLNYKPVVIAEVGINHGGSLEVAKKMALLAIKNGAQIIKHQTHIVDDEMTKAAKTIIPDNANESIYSLMKRCSLSETDEIKLKNFIEKNNTIFCQHHFHELQHLD